MLESFAKRPMPKFELQRCFRRTSATVGMLLFTLSMFFPAPASANDDEDLTKAIEILQQADQPPAQLSQQWKVVANTDIKNLSQILNAINGAEPVGANWLTMAVDAILEREAASSGEVPGVLTQFVTNTKNEPIARKTALAGLQRVDASMANQVALQLVEDPVAELRRPGIAAQIAKAVELAENEASAEEQLAAYRGALEHARDQDQVSAIAKAMADLGTPVKLADHFGYIQHWQISGPFDNAQGSGYDKPYPPEQLDLKSGTLPADLPVATDEKEDGWKAFSSDEDTGDVDLNKAISPVEQGAGYGLAQFDYHGEGPVQLRFQVQNSFKCWLNGELVYSQPIGHTGNFFDQYTVPVKLKQGSNVLLIKSCQTEPLQNIDWFKVWQFAVRLSDSTGAAIEFTQQPVMGSQSP